MQVWVEGKVLTDPEAPAVAVADHGFTVGDGVFEAAKIVDGVPFALSRHLRRLATSARALGLPPPDEARVRDGVEAVLAQEPLALGRLRITYTAGPAPMASGRVGGTPTLVVAASPMEPAYDSVAVHVVRWPRNERGALAGVKTTSYAENVVALADAQAHGAHEALFANLAGHLCEGTGSNVGYVVDGEVRTPTLASGCLAGITRELLLEWTDVREVDEPVEVLLEADEVFLLSTTRDVQPVHAVHDGRGAGDQGGGTPTRDLPAPGEVTRRLRQLWQAEEAEHPDP